MSEILTITLRRFNNALKKSHKAGFEEGYNVGRSFERLMDRSEAMEAKYKSIKEGFYLCLSGLENGKSVKELRQFMSEL